LKTDYAYYTKKSLKIPKNRQRPKGQQHTHKTKDSILKYRVGAPQGQHNGHVKPKTMAWSKAYENRKRANRYYSDMEYRRIEG
jgi:hypothetical protein